MASKQSKDDVKAVPSTSKSKTKKETPLQKESLLLVSRVLEKTEKGKIDSMNDKEILDSSDDPIKRLQYFTGLHQNYLRKLKAGDETNFDRTTVNRRDIRNELSDFYFRLKLPTTYNLFNVLQGRIPEYMDIRSFRRTLVKFGYMWRKLSKDNALLYVIERPSVTFERYFYLKNIIQYRREMRQIYFVDELVLTETYEVFDIDAVLEFKDYLPVERISKHLIFAITDQSVQLATYYDNYDVTNIETWLQFKLFHSIKPGSVIVLRNKKHTSQEFLEKPTLNSLKIELKDWLDFYNIPYEENMSKIELYTLAEKFTNTNDKLYKIDSIAKTFGAEILRLPESINDLTPARSVYKQIEKKINRVKVFETFLQSSQDIINSTDNEYLQKCDVEIADIEREIFDTDMRIDKVMDEVIEIMKKAEVSDSVDEDSDLPNCSDSD